MDLKNDFKSTVQRELFTPIGGWFKAIFVVYVIMQRIEYISRKTMAWLLHEGD